MPPAASSADRLAISPSISSSFAAVCTREEAKWCICERCCCTLCLSVTLGLQEEEDQQRAEIFEKKREREGMLARKAGNITSIRRIAAAQATARRQLTKEQQATACLQVNHQLDSPQSLDCLSYKDVTNAKYLYSCMYAKKWSFNASSSFDPSHSCC